MTSDTPRPPMTQSEPVLDPRLLPTTKMSQEMLADARFHGEGCDRAPICSCGMSTNLSYVEQEAQRTDITLFHGHHPACEWTVEGDWSKCRCGAAQTPVQPVLSGLDEAAEDVRYAGGNGTSDYWRGFNDGIDKLAARLAATAPAADETYNAAIDDVKRVLRDMPGIVDNDVNPPREMPDYIERAEAVAEVGKLRR